MKKYVISTFQVEGLHQWKEAGNYLKYPHRHMFRFVVKVSVTGSDREIEFIKLGRDTKGYVETCLLSPFRVFPSSCEQLAEAVAYYLENNHEVRDCIVQVWEDGENGAEVSSDSSSRG